MRLRFGGETARHFRRLFLLRGLELFFQFLLLRQQGVDFLFQLGDG